MTWMIWKAIVLGAVATALLAEATQALLGELEENHIPVSSLHYNAQEILGLPAPVQRYFRADLKAAANN